MKVICKYKKKRSGLLLFFNGWGCNERLVEHIEEFVEEELDLFILQDYRSLELEAAVVEEIKSYERVFVVAWSYGVWVAARSCLKYGIVCKRAVALCGTLFPMDEERGIAPSITEGTLARLTEETLRKFLLRMTGGKEQLQALERLQAIRSVADLREELRHLISAFNSSQLLDNFHYDKVIVGLKDRIFPVEAQRKAWQMMATIELPVAHYCLINYNSWNELLN